MEGHGGLRLNGGLLESQLTKYILGTLADLEQAFLLGMILVVMDLRVPAEPLVYLLKNAEIKDEYFSHYTYYWSAFIF